MFDYSRLLKDDYGLLDSQIELCELMVKHDNDIKKVCEAKGIPYENNSNIYRSLDSIKKRAARYGFNQNKSLSHPVQNGFAIKGTSTLYDDEGNPKLQWVKTEQEKQNAYDAFIKAIEDKLHEIEPRRPRKYNLNTEKDIMVKYPYSDAHIGLLTWHKEVGEDFDLDIAKDIYIKSIYELADGSIRAETAFLLDLGDTIHTDDQSNQTKASKHQLDVDGRFDKIYDTACFITISMIKILLEKHKYVIYRKTRGNHDPDSSIALAAHIEAYFRNEPRVIVERSPSQVFGYKFGKTLHVSTHGHKIKQEDLPDIAAHDFRHWWSDIDHLYCDTGHIHHKRVIETRNGICESHNTMAAGDSFNYGSGYRSKRLMQAIEYHKEKGEIGRKLVYAKYL